MYEKIGFRATIFLNTFNDIRIPFKGHCSNDANAWKSIIIVDLSSNEKAKQQKRIQNIFNSIRSREYSLSF